MSTHPSRPVAPADTIDTYTPIRWAVLSEDEKYQEYIRAIQVRGAPKCHQCEATLVVCEVCHAAWCADHGPIGLACPKCGSRPGDEANRSSGDRRYQLMRPDNTVLLTEMMTATSAHARNTILRNKGNGTFWVEVK
jgi:hypothetical protein